MRRIAAAGLTVYGLVHAWWAVAGPPPFANGAESLFPGDWLPVILAAVALVAVGRTGRLPLAAAGAALGLYSLLFPMVAVSLVFEGVATDKLTSLSATGAGVACGVLCLVVARRRPRGRLDERRAYLGAWVAVAGYLMCVALWLVDLAGGTGPAMTALVAATSPAGTVLPLALARRGRPGRGRPVPRWLLLGPAFVVGGGLTAYFGIAGMMAWVAGDFAGPFRALLPELAGGTLWGSGLLLAAASYRTVTRPAPSEGDRDHEPSASLPSWRAPSWRS
ncbi:hypothetical protein ACQP2F_23640 [Actinoplanes sp. CA-030573]|uniref:hypothetical protein n=1 Tax=Actinoplanes sp. CA-030573 TaxID=3239898 RepID=UPI003D8C60F6